MTSNQKFKKLINSKEFKEYHETQSLIREIAVQIEKVRQSKNLTQIDLAEKMGVDQAVISRMVNGANFTLKTLEKFCFATNSKISIINETL